MMHQNLTGMDEYIAYASLGDRRTRTQSLQSQTGSSRQRFRHRTSSRLSIDPPSSDRPQILAPTPRRHLLETTESQHWLRTPPLSPSTSRGASPVFQNFTQLPPSSKLAGSSNHHMSFSALAEIEKIPPSNSSIQIKTDEKNQDGNAGMGKRWIRWMHKRGMKGWVTPSVIIASTWIKWCIGLGSYSG